ncbi:hypothetical protein N9A45_00005, partial [bacterium]|nr:hypothetical protein [bacterium]
MSAIQEWKHIEIIHGNKAELIKAKKQLRDKLKDALKKEQTISRILEYRDSDSNSDSDNDLDSDSDDRVDSSELLARFVQGVDASYKHRANQEILKNMLREAKLDLERLEKMEPERREHVVKTLTIIYRNGVIRPNILPDARNDYHWEYANKRQAWTQLGEAGPAVLRPNVNHGKVRLHYQNDIVSNTIDIGTVIKRQSSSTKRKPYRFELDDPEFIKRCKGVAGRILRLTRPRIQTISEFNLQRARFSMRIFQDRVVRLPEHLDLEVSDIIRLCEYELDYEEDEDDEYNEGNYIKMIQFCEPTIHLNPAQRRRELKGIAAGKQVVLMLAEEEESSEEEEEESSEEESSDDERDGGESKSNTSSENVPFDAEIRDWYANVLKQPLGQNISDANFRRFMRAQGKRLRVLASNGGPDYGVNGNSSSEAIAIALGAELAQKAADRAEEAASQAAAAADRAEEAAGGAENLGESKSNTPYNSDSAPEEEEFEPLTFQEQLALFWYVFDTVDRDSNGTLTKNELRSYLQQNADVKQKLGVRNSTTETTMGWRELYAAIDENRNQVFERMEFAVFCAHKMSNSEPIENEVAIRNYFYNDGNRLVPETIPQEMLDEYQASLSAEPVEESTDEESSEEEVEPAGDKYAGLSRSEIRGLAKQGKLREYGVDGNSSTDDILAAARQRDAAELA